MMVRRCEPMRRFANPAEEVPDPYSKETMPRIADNYERFTKHIERRRSTPYRRLCLGERDSLALCAFGIKNGHVQNGESALDTEGRFFRGFAGRIRGFGLAVYLQPKSPMLRRLALSERSLRQRFGSDISIRSELSWFLQQRIPSLSHVLTLLSADQRRGVVRLSRPALPRVGGFLFGIGSRPSRCACLRLSLRIRRIASLRSRAFRSEGFS